MSIFTCRFTSFSSGEYTRFMNTSSLHVFIFRHSERRVDVDQWYTRLVLAMFDVIPRLADENSKTLSKWVRPQRPLVDITEL